MRREVQGLYSPIGWIHELTLLENPTFKPGQKVRLSKLNLLYGENESGKSALTEWIAGSFDLAYLSRWWDRSSGPIHLRLSYLNPQLNTVEMSIESETHFKVQINDRAVPFNPIQVRFIKLSDFRFPGADDLLSISDSLKLPVQIVRNLVSEIHTFQYARVRNLRFEANEDGITRFTPTWMEQFLSCHYVPSVVAKRKESLWNLPQRLLGCQEGIRLLF